MAISAVNNTTAFSVFTNYTANMADLKKSMSRLSTGVKTVMDDGAGVAISDRMRSQARSNAMARGNADNAISLLQTADGWLQQLSNMLARMHELAIEAADGTKTDQDRQNVQTEFKSLQEEIDRITGSAAKFNGKDLFKGDFGAGLDTQIGADAGQTVAITIGDMQKDSTVDIDTDATNTVEWGSVVDTANMSASTDVAITNISLAIDYVSKTRASVGAQQSRLENTRAGLLTYEDNLREAESRIRDVDMAQESAEMTKYQILSQVSNAMLAQANQLGSNVLQLLG